jgi:serine/threonine protein kinase
MAPEIHAYDDYQGQAVDLFALGVILFIFYSGVLPFSLAKPNDPIYKYIASNRADKFWQIH